MKKILLLITLLSIMILSGCNKFLDEVPDNRTEINSVEKVAMMLTNAYPKATFANFINPRCDFMTDKGLATGTNSYSFNTDSFFWNDVAGTSTDTPDDFWASSYYGISQVNHALEAIENMGSPKEANPYIGEAKVIRAFNHFLLACVFSKLYDKDSANDTYGIPYVTEPERVIVKKYDRETVKETWDKIEKDLLEGISNLGSDGIYKVPAYHFTNKAAMAFASRFYLYKSDWNKVIEYSSKLIPNATMLTPEGNVSANDPANIFARGNFQPYMTSINTTASSSTDIRKIFSSSANPANLLITDMLSYIGLRQLSLKYGPAKEDSDATVGNSINVSGGRWAYKAYGSTAGWYIPKFYYWFVYTSMGSSGGNYYSVFPYLRIEEALLNRIEAYIMTDQLDKAINDINIFMRQRAKTNSSGTPIYDEITLGMNIDKIVLFYKDLVNAENHFMKVYNAYGSASWSLEKKCLAQCLLDLRRNEFSQEGIRYWDLIRYKIPVTHTKYTGEQNTLYPGDDRWVIQVPQITVLAEIETNPRTNLLSRVWSED